MAENLWETNGGVYFGNRILPDKAAHDRSLLDEDWQVVRDKFHHYTGDRHLVTVARPSALRSAEHTMLSENCVTLMPTRG